MTEKDIESIKLWLLTKADADRERAESIALREPFLAKLLKEDALYSEKLATSLNAAVTP